jgi:hypothetical protein
MDRHQDCVYILTRLTINPEGEVVSKNLAATFDLFEAESYRSSAVENDFERYPLPAGWRDDVEQSSFVAAMRNFREIVEEMQDAALRWE